MAVLHEIIAAGNGRLAAALSPQVASEFAGLVATDTLRRLGFDKDADGGMESVRRLMQGLGMKLTMEKVETPSSPATSHSAVVVSAGGGAAFGSATRRIRTAMYGLPGRGTARPLTSMKW